MVPGHLPQPPCGTFAQLALLAASKAACPAMPELKPQLRCLEVLQRPFRHDPCFAEPAGGAGMVADQHNVTTYLPALGREACAQRQVSPHDSPPLKSTWPSCWLLERSPCLM